MNDDDDELKTSYIFTKHVKSRQLRSTNFLDRSTNFLKKY